MGLGICQIQAGFGQRLSIHGGAARAGAGAAAVRCVDRCPCFDLSSGVYGTIGWCRAQQRKRGFTQPKRERVSVGQVQEPGPISGLVQGRRRSASLRSATCPCPCPWPGCAVLVSCDWKHWRPGNGFMPTAGLARTTKQIPFGLVMQFVSLCPSRESGVNPAC